MVDGQISVKIGQTCEHGGPWVAPYKCQQCQLNRVREVRIRPVIVVQDAA